jgi:hypothetical protein
MKQMKKSVWVIFWITVGFFFIAVVGTMFAPPIMGSAMPYFMFSAFAVFAGLGVTLLVLTVRTKVAGILKAFLLLTGAAAVGFPVFAVLHNLVYALLILWLGEDFWGAGGDEPVFFILAAIVCPIAFLVGAVGTIIINIKNKRAESTSQNI